MRPIHIFLIIAACSWRWAAPGCRRRRPAWNSRWGRRKALTITGSRSITTRPGRGRRSSCCTASGPAPIPGGFWARPWPRITGFSPLISRATACRISPTDGKYAISDQADLVAEFIRTRDLHDLVVMGHSMGGGVTLMTYFKVREDDPGPDQEAWCSSTAPATPRRCPGSSGSPGFPCSIPWEPGCCRPGSPPPWC